MRCYCCNKMLSDYEATRRSVMTNQFLDMCNVCYQTVSVDIVAIERPDLRHEDEEESFHDVINTENLTMWNENE